MKKQTLLKDILKALLLGLALAAGFSLSAFLAGFISGGVPAALEAAKDTALFLGALLFFLTAGMILARGKNGSVLKNGSEAWKRHFPCAGPETVAGLAACGFIIVGSLFDFLQRNLMA